MARFEPRAAAFSALVRVALCLAPAAAAFCSSGTRPEKMVVVQPPAGAGAPFFTWPQCNALANAGKGYTTARINATEHAGAVTTLDVQHCHLNCLDPDSFNFEGAGSVAVVLISFNNFVALPEGLLANMASLVEFHARCPRRRQ